MFSSTWFIGTMLWMSKKSKKSQKFSLNISSAYIRVIFLAATVIFMGSVWAWWHILYSKPEMVFSGAINNALQTSSFSRTTIEKSDGQGFNQKVDAITEPKQFVGGTNEISQSGEGGYTVKTDMFGTPKSDFVRYSSIKTDQKSAEGKDPDYSSIIGIWGKSSADDNTTSGQLYSQTVMGVVPFGNLSLADRRVMIDLINDKKVYKVNYGKVVRSIQSHRPTYTYEVTVSPEAYITMLKKYASIVGLNQLDKIEAATYKDSPPLEFKFTIDVWTRQINKIVYANSRSDSYGSYGARNLRLNPPTKTITIDELQQKIQKASQ